MNRLPDPRTGDDILTRWQLCCARWVDVVRLARWLGLYIPRRRTRETEWKLINRIIEATRKDRRAA